MDTKAAHLKQYVKYLYIIAFACAALEIIFAIAFRGGMFLHLDSLDRLEASFLVLYLLNVILFVAVGVGLRDLREWVHGTMLVMSAVGTVCLVTLFVAGAFLGGFVPGMAYLLSTLLQPIAAGAVSLELIFILLPVILFFNPFNLYLFGRDATLKSIFLPPQKEATVLKRKEL